MKKLLITAAIFSATSVAATADMHKHNDHQDRIGFEKAKTIALDAVRKSLVVTEVELEIDEDGEASYEIEVEAGGVATEVEIDAKTGEVLEMEADD